MLQQLPDLSMGPWDLATAATRNTESYSSRHFTAEHRILNFSSEGDCFLGDIIDSI